MHHMTANWSPRAQAERGQRCYGVWGVLGTTRGWPQVVNIWEEDGFDGLGRSFRHERRGPGTAGPAPGRVVGQGRRAAAWAGSAPAPRPRLPRTWTIARAPRRRRDRRDVCPRARHRAGRDVGRLPRDVRQDAVPAYEAFGWELAGAWETLMTKTPSASSSGPSRRGAVGRARACPTDASGDGPLVGPLPRAHRRVRRALPARRRARCPFRSHRQPAYLGSGSSRNQRRMTWRQ